MKKKVIPLVIVAMLIILVAVSMHNQGGNTRNVERIVGKSSIYTEEEINVAMDVTEQKFKQDFEGCKLLRIGYDEGKTLSGRKLALKWIILIRIGNGS